MLIRRRVIRTIFAQLPRRTALALVACAAALALFSSARCYPPGTRVVVLIPGLYTELRATAQPSDNFNEDQSFPIVKKLIEAGYKPESIAIFGFEGGAMTEDGVWQPNPFPCESSDRPAATHMAKLEEMLRAYRERHPQAHFTRGGHRGGGYGAFLAGAREAERAPEDRLGIDAVVTLHAPLNGVDADKRLAISAIECDKTFAAAAEIVADKANPGIRALRIEQVAAMQREGMRVATLGSIGDCLYNLKRCVGASLAPVDDTESQFVENADLVKRYPLTGGDVFLSHFMLLKHPVPLKDIAEFIGAP